MSGAKLFSEMLLESSGAKSKKNNAYRNSVEKEIADATKILDVLKSKNSIDFSTKEQEHLLKQTIKMFEDIVADRSLILKEM